MKELYKKHRPKKLEEIVGQRSAVVALQKMLQKDKIPHCILLSGPSGCGKTTIARILAKSLKCSIHDFKEINCADFRGIDMVRDIRYAMMQAPLNGSSRMWVIDECHKLSNDAQNAFLKLLEDTPNHVYFILATTEPEKLLKTIRTRSTEITLKSLTDKELKQLLLTVLHKENIQIKEQVIEKIIELSDGSARKGLVLLDQVIHLDEEEQLRTLADLDTEKETRSIASALFDLKITWDKMAKILSDSDLTDVERIRWGILGYAKSILLKGGKMAPRAYLVLDLFKEPFYDSKAAGLVWACYTIIQGSK